MVRLVRLGWLVRLGQLVRLGSLGRLLPGPAGATGLKWTELRRTGAVPELDGTGTGRRPAVPELGAVPPDLMIHQECPATPARSACADAYAIAVPGEELATDVDEAVSYAERVMREHVRRSRQADRASVRHGRQGIRPTARQGRQGRQGQE